MSSTKELPRSVLGVQGHFGNLARFESGIDPRMVEMAHEYGGHIRTVAQEAGGRQMYALIFPAGDGSQDFIGDLKDMKQHLARLHRPVFTAINQAVRTENQSGILGNIWHSGDTGRQVQDEREKMLSVLRFMTTGSPILPALERGDLREDHSATEESIRLANMWRKTGEIGKENISGNVPMVIPAASFHPAKGFQLELHPDFTNGKGDGQKSLTALRDWAWDAVDTVTDGRYKAQAQRPQSIHLSPDEFARLCAAGHEAMKGKEFSGLLQEAKLERRAAEAIARIDSGVSNLQSSMADVNALDEAAPKEKLKKLGLATTALTPVLASEALRERWAHYFYTERKDAPMDSILEDVNVLRRVMDDYGQGKSVTHAHVEAIASDPAFFGLLSFEREMTRVLGEAVKSDKHMPAAKMEELTRGYQYLQSMFESASASGMMMNREHLNEKQKDILDVLERSAGQGESGITRVGSEFVGSSVDFFKDIYTFPFLSPKHFASTCAVLGWVAYLRYGGDPAAVSQAVDAVAANSFSIGADTGMNILGLENATTAAMDMGAVLDEKSRDLLTNEQCQAMPTLCHLNDSVLGPYKHFTIDKAVVGTSQTLLSLAQTAIQAPMSALGVDVNPAPSFMDAALKSVKETGDVAYKLNIFQNVAGHMAMAASLSVMAAQSGVRSAGRIFGFFDGFFNAALSTVKERPLMIPAAVATFAFEPQNLVLARDIDTGLAFELLAAVGGYALWDRKGKSVKELHTAITENAQKISSGLEDGSFKMPDARAEILESLAKAGLLKAEIEAGLPADVREVSLGLKQKGLRSEFTISSDNLKPTLTALQQFDVAIDVASRYMGEENRVYQSFIHGKITSCIRSMKDFQTQAIDAQGLEKNLRQNLKDVIAAQIFLGGSSDIHKNIYGTELSEKDALRLHHHGKVQHGIQTRQQAFEEHGKNARALKEELGKIDSAPLFLSPMELNDPLKRSVAVMARQSEKLETGAKVAWEYIKQGRNRVWDKIVQGAQGVQGVVQEVPYKKQVAMTLTAAGLGLVGANFAGEGGEAVDQLASAYGVGAGVLLTSAIFLMVNIPDDLIAAHLGLGAPSYAAGAGVYAGRKYVGQPAYNYLKEKIEEVRDSLQRPPEEKIEVREEEIAEITDVCKACAKCIENDGTKCPVTFSIMQLHEDRAIS